MSKSSAKAARTSIERLPTHIADETAPRIRAYLAMVRPPRGSEFSDESDERYHRGRSVIERMALSAISTQDPQLRLSLVDCANVLFFIVHSEPIDQRTWWKEPDDAPSHLMGEYIVLEAIQNRLRQQGGT